MLSIACVYTGMGALVDNIEAKFKAALGEAKFYHILDSGLISDVVAAGTMTPAIETRLAALFTAAAGAKPDILVSTCSSIGEAAERFAESHPGVNVLRIDYPMAKYAARHADKVAVLATLETTVGPSVRLVERLAAELGRDVEVVSATAPGAFEALIGGNITAATEAVVKTARELCSDADVILLAQASMLNFKAALTEALGDEAVMLDSPTTCAEYLREKYAGDIKL